MTSERRSEAGVTARSAVPAISVINSARVTTEVVAIIQPSPVVPAQPYFLLLSSNFLLLTRVVGRIHVRQRKRTRPMHLDRRRAFGGGVVVHRSRKADVAARAELGHLRLIKCVAHSYQEGSGE